MNAKPELSIFTYLDYRKFLADYYHFKKSLNRHFSHRHFALKAGIKSSGYLSEVITRKRNLTKLHIEKFALAMDLGEKEKTYFELMVSFSHAESDDARKHIYEMMLKTMPVHVQQVRLSQMEYFAKWYHVAVREALAIFHIKGDGEELAKVLDPPISPAKAKAAMRVLQRLRLVERDAEGCWRASHASLLSMEDPGAALVLRAFEREMMYMAADSLERVDHSQRDVSCVTMSVSHNGLKNIKHLVAEFHKQVQAIVRADREEDRVIQLNLQVFPLTRNEDAHGVAKI